MLFAHRVARLEQRLGDFPSLLIALSGGVDSAALLGAARRAVSGRVVAATTFSAAVPAEEVSEAREVATLIGVEHRVVATDELSDSRYRANSGDRCYFCRVAMYGALKDLARAEGLAAVADGLQAEDAIEDRPGIRAAKEDGILHPLRDAGLTKADVRRLVRAYGLFVHDKPAQPCLASRVRVGVEVTERRLARVHRAEDALRRRGFRVLRVRDDGDAARIVVGPGELSRARSMESELVGLVTAAGFAIARLDTRPYGD